jgi:hypothetical protein
MKDQALRKHLLELLGGGHAHLDFEEATAGMPSELYGAKPPGLPFTPWRLVEHMRIAQWDILQFTVDPHHVSPDFPDGYWPPDDARPKEGSIYPARTRPGSNNPSGGTAGCGPQRIPLGPARDRATSSRRMAQ